MLIHLNIFFLTNEITYCKFYYLIFSFNVLFPNSRLELIYLYSQVAEYHWQITYTKEIYVEYSWAYYVCAQ